jgi:hypothetical protein
MANHEASGRRCKARALVWPALLAAFAAAVPAGALEELARDATITPAFTLGLEAAFRTQPPSGDGPDSDAVAPAPLRTNAAVTLGDVRAIAKAMLQETPATTPAEPAKADGSFGRWMKRHWWVPALVGAAVLATAGESLYDDDDEDDDD